MSKFARAARSGWPFGLAGAAIGGIGMLMAAYPALLAAIPECGIRQTTGLCCPACGMSRSIAALGSGDLSASLQHNAMLVPFVVACTYAWTSVLRSPRATRSDLRSVLMPFVVAVAAFTVLRNMPTPLSSFLRSPS